MMSGVAEEQNAACKPVMKSFYTAGSWYEMNEPLVHHNVQPVTTTWSIMVNGPPYLEHQVHMSAPTTKGKDLSRMKEEEVESHLKTGWLLFKEWIRGLNCERCGR